MRRPRAVGYDPPDGPRRVRRSAVVHGASQLPVARAGPAGVHGHRARALGRAPAAGASDLRARLAGARGARRARLLLPVADQVRDAALRLRAGDAGRACGCCAPASPARSIGVWWTMALWHPVLPPHRARRCCRAQAILGQNLFGRPVPTSLVQFWVPRVELHLFYNTIVFIPMVIAMYYHMFPPASKKPRGRNAPARCTREPPHARDRRGAARARRRSHAGAPPAARLPRLRGRATDPTIACRGRSTPAPPAVGPRHR